MAGSAAIGWDYEEPSLRIRASAVKQRKTPVFFFFFFF